MPQKKEPYRPKNKIVHIVPAEGAFVPDPDTKQFLPACGKRVDLDAPGAGYWRKRLATGDVVEQQPASVDKKTKQ